MAAVSGTSVTAVSPKPSLFEAVPMVSTAFGTPALMMASAVGPSTGTGGRSSCSVGGTGGVESPAGAAGLAVGGVRGLSW